MQKVSLDLDFESTAKAQMGTIHMMYFRDFPYFEFSKFMISSYVLLGVSYSTTDRKDLWRNVFTIFFQKTILPNISCSTFLQILKKLVKWQKSIIAPCILTIFLKFAKRACKKTKIKLKETETASDSRQIHTYL